MHFCNVCITKAVKPFIFNSVSFWKELRLISGIGLISKLIWWILWKCWNRSNQSISAQEMCFFFASFNVLLKKVVIPQRLWIKQQKIVFKELSKTVFKSFIFRCIVVSFSFVTVGAKHCIFTINPISIPCWKKWNKSSLCDILSIIVRCAWL